VFGEFFLDLVFFKLPRVPKMGEEVKTIHFAQSPGGGVATTSLVAAGLGTPTAVVTRLGTDARRNPAWQKLVGSGIYTGACEFSAKFPTAMTVCAAYDGDRMMITHDAINQRLHTLLMRAAVRRQFHKAKHLHLDSRHSQTTLTGLNNIRRHRVESGSPAISPIARSAAAV